MESITQTFSEKTVQEVIELEKKLRNEIEVKKEELRQMVGERYRDLIEAADTIGEMKTCSASVKDSVKRLQKFYTSKSFARRSHTLLKKQPPPATKNSYMEIAAQAKVLMEIPEKIWSLVESGHMINASFLYLQSLYILKNLSLDGKTNYSPLLLWFPMLGQQAQAIGNLRTSILKECRNRIRNHLLDKQQLAESLCSIVILEKISVTKVLQVLLDARSAIIREILSEEFSSTDQNNIGTQTRITDSVAIVQQTVMHIFELFCDGSGGLVGELLLNCASTTESAVKKFLSQGDSSKIWMKYLPKDTSWLNDFKCKGVAVDIDVVQSVCLAWFASCSEVLTCGIKELLTFSGSAKDLANIRTELFKNFLSPAHASTIETSDDDWQQPSQENLVKKEQNPWVRACKVIFNREIFLWSELLQQLFLQKIDSLIEFTFTNLLKSSQTIFCLSSKFQTKPEFMSSYVWQENDTDISPSMAWTPWQTRKENNLSAQGGLCLKVAFVTPDLRVACEGINDLMVKLLTDLNFFAPGIFEEKQQSFQHFSNSSEKFKDENKTVLEHLRSYCYKYLQSLLDHIEKIEVDLNESEPKRNSVNQDDVLSLSLLCRNYFDLCHYFKLCCCSFDNHSLMKRQYSRNHDKKSQIDQTNDSELAWKKISDLMAQKSHNLMNVWCKAVLNVALKVYKEDLLASATNGKLLNSMTLWEAFSVEEENESGEKVTSQIKIPATITSHTQRFLYGLCSELQRVGGHSSGRSIVHYLSQQALMGIYEAFSIIRRTLAIDDASLHGQNSTNTVLSQTWALQCIFDIQYLHTLLYQTSLSFDAVKLENQEEEDEDDDQIDPDSSSYTYTEIVDWLQSFVDPFDLNVFTPYIERNIDRYIVRTSNLVGMLVSSEKLKQFTFEKSSSTVKESHNIMPLAADCGRFSYLPVSGRSANAKASQRLSRSLARQRPLSSALSGLTFDSGDPNGRQENRMTSSLYSKLGVLSSSWLSMNLQNEE